MEQRDVAHVGYPRHRLEEPEASNRTPIESNVEQEAESIIRRLEDERRVDLWPSSLTPPDVGTRELQPIEGAP